MPETVVTTCPECGAKIPKAGMSICPYCVAPLKESPGKGVDRKPILERLSRMAEKPELSDALALEPPWSPEYQGGKDRGVQGSVLAVGGLVVLGLGLSFGAGPFGFVSVAGAVLTIIGVVLLVGGRATCARLDRIEVQKRAACIIERRSEADANGGGGVCYYFHILFADGTEGEFAYPGRGVTEALYTNGMTGVAFTRGPELLAIERVRV